MKLEERPESMSKLDWYLANITFRKFFFITVGLGVLTFYGVVLTILLLYNIFIR